MTEHPGNNRKADGMVAITIDGKLTEVHAEQTVLAAARLIGLDIPALCYLEKCGPLNSCLACVVKINGKLVPSCGTKVQAGMVVESETEEVHTARRTALELLFSDHLGDCLSPCHRLCPLGLNIPVMLRQIQTAQIELAGTTVRMSLPLAGVLGRLCHHPCEQGCRRGSWDDPAAIRDMERFVTEREYEHRRAEAAKGALANSDRSQPWSIQRSAQTKASGKAVVVIGAGPTGLAAAYYLKKFGHSITVVDRNATPGGSLRGLSEEHLPASVLASEVSILGEAGVEFKLGVELGADVTIDGLLRGFDAILLTTGEPGEGDAEKYGIPQAGAGLKANPNTCETPMPKVFAAGAVVKPVKQLVRAMAEGRAAAECVHRFLANQPVRRPEKSFSSTMGRLEVGELRQFLANGSLGGCVTPCDRCAGHSPQEAAAEASRCLHCDCRSSGNCLLQHYAQVYSAEAGRYRGERRKFEQFMQAGGVIFEPGKCILCGICVKLTELAREPLGLTFIGRGFDVRIGAPLNRTIEEGLQKIAEECIQNCPTGALEWNETAQHKPGSAVK